MKNSFFVPVRQAAFRVRIFQNGGEAAQQSRVRVRVAACAGFTLIELLAVLAIMAMLAVALTPALQAFNSAGALTKASADIAGMLESARAYAMANGTYVYVGIQEVDGINPTNANGTGRIVVAVIASADGVRPYTTLGGSPTITSDVVVVNKIQTFNSVHLATAASLTNGSNMTSRPMNSGSETSLVFDMGSNTPATTTFNWPIGNASGQNFFSKVIEFDPQGVAHVQTGDTFNPSVVNYIEIPLVSAHGDQAVTTTTALQNQAAVQVDGVTGAVRIYRP